jgi:23S rRNA-/tRNA-specific pseudouridylate synthase
MPALPPILHEDAALLVLDKPAGLPLVPERGDRARVSLMDLVRERCGATVANVHRIDPEASGVVLYAKTKPALDFLSGQFQSKTVEKVHEALVVGLPAQERYTVDLVLKEDEGAPGRMCVVKRHGQAAVTDCEVRARF